MKYDLPFIFPGKEATPLMAKQLSDRMIFNYLSDRIHRVLDFVKTFYLHIPWTLNGGIGIPYFLSLP